LILAKLTLCNLRPRTNCDHRPYILFSAAADAADAKRKRAERFGVELIETEEDKRAKRAARFGIPVVERTCAAARTSRAAPPSQ
jgi:hypothetical protein